MKKRTTIILVIIAMLLAAFCGSALAAHLIFSDAKGHWCEKCSELSSESLPDGTAKTEDTITRSEFVSLVVHMMGLQDYENDNILSSFSDIEGTWAENYIETLVANRIIQKDDYDGVFRPDDPITRNEIIRILNAIGSVDKTKDTAQAGGDDNDGNISNEDNVQVNPSKDNDSVPGNPDKNSKPDSGGTNGKPSSPTDVPDKNQDPVKDPDKGNDNNQDEDQPDQGNPPDNETGNGTDNSNEENNGNPHSGGGNGGSSSVPQAQITLSAPDYGYTDLAFEIKAVLKNTKFVSWNLARMDEKGEYQPAALDKLSEGMLSNDGGSIRMTESGSYRITATALNSRNRETTQSVVIKIYEPDILSLEMPDVTHTDKEITVAATGPALEIEWALLKGAEQIPMNGELSEIGGTFTIADKGSYTLKAVGTNDKGRKYEATAAVTVYPVPVLDFALPATLHTDDTYGLATKFSEMDGLTAVWSLTRNGTAVELSDYIEGELTNSGGEIQFPQKGVYTLTATATDKTGRVFTSSATTTVHPVAAIGFEMPEITHTDSSILVKTTFDEVGSPVIWSLTKNGEAVALADCLDGEFTNDGGTIRFKNKGDYELKAVYTDEAGRAFYYTSKITVYPVPVLDFTLPATLHTDDTHVLEAKLTEMDGLTAAWSLTRNGEATEFSDFMEGELTNSGGTIRFPQKGVYILTATVTDKTGRVFTFPSTVTVYPVAAVGFYVPEIAHTDSGLVVETAFSETEAPVSWSLTRNGEAAALSDYIEGELSNDGGTIRFVKKGSYILKASYTDGAGRSYDYQCETKVYPVPELTISLPKTAHTDSRIDVVASAVDLDGLTVEWLIDNTYGFQDWGTFVDGTLANDGGAIRLTRAGVYDLYARVTDETGRVFRFAADNKIEALPVLYVTFELPESAFTDSELMLRTRGNNNVLPVVWSLTKDGQAVSVSDNITGILNAQGGDISFRQKGSYVLTAAMTDALGRSYEYSRNINVYPVLAFSYDVPSNIRTGGNIAVSQKTFEHADSVDSLEWKLLQNGQPLNWSDYINGSLSISGGNISIQKTGDYTLKVIAVGNGRTYENEYPVSVINTPPTAPVITADVTRTGKNQKVLVNISVNSTDADGDKITYEYEGVSADSYYGLGAHTVKVRAKDEYGAYSAWSQTTFTVANQAPSTPVITRTPDGNSIEPGRAITITAASSDPDGDSVTLIWENRNAETQVYPLGKQVVRVKAVDSLGAESPWTAIVFFVSSSSGGGGMTLTGPESTIIEPGLEGATITGYTFTVPPVSGHSGSDYGRVRGYNVQTGQWDQLSYGTTSNGITFTKTLTAGVYSKLEFYYYTNHDCMYNKSNITYSVNFYFAY